MKATARPTIHDVAARAGVSKSLVSLVLRDAPHVSDDKRRAVWQAIEELGYRPDRVARSLVSRRTRVIGVMLSDLHNPFFAEVVDGLDDEAKRAGYHPLIDTGNRAVGQEAAAVEMLLELRVDGLVLAGPQLGIGKIAEAARVAPVVIVGRATRNAAVDSVVNDDRAGVRAAVEHLAGLGHRRIAHVDGGAAPAAKVRRHAYEATMTDLGLAAHVQVARGAFTEEGGVRGTEELLDRRPRPTAILAANDMAALGALGVLGERGLDVPGEVSLVGYDNTSIAGLQHISLTTVDQPRFEMGAAAMRLLSERLDHGRTGAEHLVMAPSLVERGTTAPPG